MSTEVFQPDTPHQPGTSEDIGKSPERDDVQKPSEGVTDCDENLQTEHGQLAEKFVFKKTQFTEDGLFGRPTLDTMARTVIRVAIQAQDTNHNQQNPLPKNADYQLTKAKKFIAREIEVSLTDNDGRVRSGLFKRSDLLPLLAAVKITHARLRSAKDPVALALDQIEANFVGDDPALLTKSQMDELRQRVLVLGRWQDIEVTYNQSASQTQAISTPEEKTNGI